MELYGDESYVGEDEDPGEALMSGNKGSGWPGYLDRDGGSDGDRGGVGTKLESEGNDSIGISANDGEIELGGT